VINVTASLAQVAVVVNTPNRTPESLPMTLNLVVVVGAETVHEGAVAPEAVEAQEEEEVQEVVAVQEGEETNDQVKVVVNLLEVSIASETGVLCIPFIKIGNSSMAFDSLPLFSTLKLS